MTLIQYHFESDYEPPTVITRWWDKYGLGNDALKLPNPIGTGEASTCGGYEDNLWLNLELWGTDSDKRTICRLSAVVEPFDRSLILSVFERVANSLQPAPRTSSAASAFAPDQFTFIGGWDWTGDGPPNHWTMAQSSEARSKFRAGLCAADGSLLGDATSSAKWGLVSATKNVVYLGYDYVVREDGEMHLQVVDGSARVPLSQIPGVRIVRNENCAYSAALSSDRTRIATIQYKSRGGYIHLIDVETGIITPLTWFEDATGGEDVMFSPDDKWLLVPRTSRNHGALIINVETGEQREFRHVNHETCWWVRNGHLGLLIIGAGEYDTESADPYTVRFFDLTTGEESEIVRITPPADKMEQLYQWLWDAEPRSDGTIIVQKSEPHPTEEDFGYGNLTLLDLNTGSLTTPLELFADPERQIRRKMEKWKWNSPLENTITTPATVLESGFRSEDLSSWPEFDDAQYGAILAVDFDSPMLTVSQ